jgi:uncharacterized protein (UPF0210 family)
MDELMAGYTKEFVEQLQESKSELEAKLHQWEQMGQDVAAILEEIANTRVSQMATTHHVADIMAQNNRALLMQAAKLRELNGG